jgi:hypothetical protein
MQIGGGGGIVWLGSFSKITKLGTFKKYIKIKNKGKGKEV